MSLLDEPFSTSKKLTTLVGLNSLLTFLNPLNQSILRGGNKQVEKMNEIEKLKEEESHIIRLLELNRSEQRKLNLKEFVLKHKIQIGDVVKYPDGKKTIKALVDRVEYSGTEPRRFVVKLYNANNSVGLREAKIWEFDVEKVVVIDHVKPKQ